MVNVDPLASNKSYWSQILGFGDFYFEGLAKIIIVSVQIAQICILSRDRNGGLLDLEYVQKELAKIRGSRSPEISDEDIIQSVKCLRPLGDGFSVVEFGGKRYIRSLPTELSPDLTCIVAACASSPSTLSRLQSALGWELERVCTNIDSLIQQSILWVDEQNSEPCYWVAGEYF